MNAQKRPNDPPESQTRQVAAEVVRLGLEMIPTCDEKTFAAIATATLNAAKVLDALPTSSGEVTNAERVRLAREERLRAAKAGVSPVAYLPGGDSE